jgi:hypothetical protein
MSRPHTKNHLPPPEHMRSAAKRVPVPFCSPCRRTHENVGPGRVWLSSSRAEDVGGKVWPTRSDGLNESRRLTTIYVRAFGCVLRSSAKDLFAHAKLRALYSVSRRSRRPAGEAGLWGGSSAGGWRRTRSKPTRLVLIRRAPGWCGYSAGRIPGQIAIRRRGYTAASLARSLSNTATPSCSHTRPRRR